MFSFKLLKLIHNRGVSNGYWLRWAALNDHNFGQGCRVIDYLLDLAVLVKHDKSPGRYAGRDANTVSRWPCLGMS